MWGDVSSIILLIAKELRIILVFGDEPLETRLGHALSTVWGLRNSTG